MIFNWNQNLLKQLPEFTRARGPYLYTRKGERFLDLWLMGGFALMGHRAGHITQTLKNRISTGLVFDLPSIHQKRLKKQLQKEFPEYSSFNIYDSWDQAQKDIQKLLGTEDFSVNDPLFSPDGGHVGLWRPFAPSFRKSPSVLLPVLPFQIGGGPIIAGYKRELRAPEQHKPASPLLSEALSRSLYDLKKFVPPQIKMESKELKNWEYRNHYLVPMYSEKDYSAIFESFLSQKIILSPYYGCPSFLCAEISKGDTTKLLNLLEL